MAASEELSRLQREMTQLQQTLGSARQAVRGELVASDPDRLITLHLGPDLNLTRIEVGRRGTEAGLDALVTALNQASTQAEIAVSQRWADRVDEDRHGGSRTPRQGTPTRTAATPTSSPTGSVDTVLDGLRHQLGTAQRMRREGARQGEVVGPDPIRGRSENGRLTVVLVGEDIQAIETNEHWIRSRSPLELGRLLLEALTDALAQYRRRGAESSRQEYQQLARAFGRTADQAWALSRQRGIR